MRAGGGRALAAPIGRQPGLAQRDGRAAQRHLRRRAARQRRRRRRRERQPVHEALRERRHADVLDLPGEPDARGL